MTSDVGDAWKSFWEDVLASVSGECPTCHINSKALREEFKRLSAARTVEQACSDCEEHKARAAHLLKEAEWMADWAGDRSNVVTALRIELERRVGGLEEELAVMSVLYDNLRITLCSLCAKGLCSAHQPSTGVILNMRRERGSGS